MELLEMVGINLFMFMLFLFGVGIGALCMKAVYDEDMKQLRHDLKIAQYDARFNMNVKVGK